MEQHETKIVQNVWSWRLSDQIGIIHELVAQKMYNYCLLVSRYTFCLSNNLFMISQSLIGHSHPVSHRYTVTMTPLDKTWGMYCFANYIPSILILRSVMMGQAPILLASERKKKVSLSRRFSYRSDLKVTESCGNQEVKQLVC